MDAAVSAPARRVAVQLRHARKVGRDAARRRMAAHGRPGDDGRAGLLPDRRPAQGYDHRSARISSPPRSKRSSTANRPSPRWRSSACPTSAGARHLDILVEHSRIAPLERCDVGRVDHELGADESDDNARGGDDVRCHIARDRSVDHRTGDGRSLRTLTRTESDTPRRVTGLQFVFLAVSRRRAWMRCVMSAAAITAAAAKAYHLYRSIAE